MLNENRNLTVSAGRGGSEADGAGRTEGARPPAPKITQETCDRARLLWSMYGRKQAAEMVGINPSTLTAIKKRGWKPASYQKRPMPIDFPTKAARLGVKELCRHYRAGCATVGRWSRELGVKPPLKRGLHLPKYHKQPERPLPDDYNERQKTMTLRELCRHYRAGYPVVKRWQSETPDPRPAWQGRHRENMTKKGEN